MANRRQQQLLDVVDNLVTVHNEWSEDEARPIPDATYWDAVDGVFTAFSHGDIPEACRPALLAVEALRAAHDEFQNEANEANQYPGNSFWDAINGLKASRTAKPVRELPPLETMQQLMSLPGMKMEQVARTYGLVDSNGNPQIHLVQKELDKPGSVINNETWTDPRLKLIERSEAASDDLHRTLLQRKTDAHKATSEPCKETPEELHALQGMTARQAAQMLHMPEAEVAKRFAELDKAREHERQTAVLEMSSEGWEPKDIARELGMKAEAVKRIIVAAKESESAAATAGVK